MQKREKILAVVAAATVLVAGAKFGMDGLVEAFSSRKARCDALSIELEGKRSLVARGRRASRQLAELESRALASDAERGRSQYQNWLTGLIEKVGMAAAEVGSSPPQSHADAYQKLAFSVRAQGTIEQVTQLLYEFYSVDMLHQVRSVSLVPAAGVGQLDFSASIEALSLAGTPTDAKLRLAEADRLAWSSLDDYQKPIAKRNLFAAYSAPRPPRATSDRESPATPAFDKARYTFVTAILSVDGEPQVWLNVRPTGQVLKLRAGEDFTIDKFRAKVTNIEPKQIEIAIGDERQRIKLGQNLREAVTERNSSLAY